MSNENKAVAVILEELTSEYASPVDDLIAKHLPRVLELFRSKARDYSDRSGIFAAEVLGAPGQFAEIWRKIPKLKKGMWDQDALENETVEEILFDLIGHCLLALDMIPDSMRIGQAPSGHSWIRGYEIGEVRRVPSGAERFTESDKGPIMGNQLQRSKNERIEDDDKDED
ncbi:hypothetical protein ERK16_64 [Mycobacterium phage Erk16]|uniref:Uncharacterized protein n=1 Tax=Mycobacterium phage Erk16 TaxID=2234027 RepID=A0A2Z4Q064_9CAUD|nr:hypothetical protein ERK16_64 [Mycobacterium phage Erk16]